MQKLMLVVLTLLSAVIASADFDQADRLYAEKKYAEAFPIYLRMAEIGHVYARFNVGVMYYNGQHAEQDYAQGFAWMKLAEGHHDQIDQQVAKVYESFTDLEKQEADLAFGRLQEQFGEAALAANLYPSPRADEDCPPLAKPIFSKQPKYPIEALRKGYMGGVVVVFDVDEHGRVINPEAIAGQEVFFEEALKAMAAHKFEPNRPESGLMYRVMFEIKGYNEKYLAKHMEQIKREADQGDARAKFIYAATSMVSPQRQSFADLNSYLLDSSVSGIPQAQYLLANNLLRGQGCEVDKPKAMSWLQKSATSDYAPAQFLIAKELEDSNPTAALLMLENAVDSGHIPAMMKLAWLLATNEQNSDPVRALKLAKAAERKHADKITAWSTLAAAYAANQDYSKAVKFQKKALKKAKKEAWQLAELEVQLARYSNKEPWINTNRET